MGGGRIWSRTSDEMQGLVGFWNNDRAVISPQKVAGNYAVSVSSRLYPLVFGLQKQLHWRNRLKRFFLSCITKTASSFKKSHFKCSAVKYAKTSMFITGTVRYNCSYSLLHLNLITEIHVHACTPTPCQNSWKLMSKFIKQSMFSRCLPKESMFMLEITLSRVVDVYWKSWCLLNE